MELNRKKALVLIFITFVAIFLMTLNVGASSNDPIMDGKAIGDNFLQYENSDCDIRMKYPKEWYMQEKLMGTTVIFMSPLENESDRFRDNVNIIVQDLSKQPMSLDEFTKISLDQINQFITDVSLKTSEKTKLMNYSAYKVIYTGKQGQFSLKWMQIWAINNNFAYIISYSAQDISYDMYLGLVEQMLASFETIE